MAGKDISKKIAALGSLCGITSQYWDNFGRRHRTSQATYRDLLTAMGVPWEDPETLDREIARRRLGPWGALLEPVQLIKPAPALSRATVRVWSPGPEPPAAVEVIGEMVSENGERHRWETRLAPAGRLKSRAVPGGFRFALNLPLPANLDLGYYDLTLKVRSGGREETGRTRLIAAPSQAYAPAWLEKGRRAWGFNLPLYALRSRANWGVGDFADLMAVIRWAGPLGAAFVGVNPLHAAGGRATADPSPYAPTSRIFLNVLYLSLEAAPEMAACRKAQDLMASPEFQAAKARLAAGRAGALRGSPPFKAPGPESPVPDVLRDARRPGGSRPLGPGAGVRPVCGGRGRVPGQVRPVFRPGGSSPGRRLAALARIRSAPRQPRRG